MLWSQLQLEMVPLFTRELEKVSYFLTIVTPIPCPCIILVVILFRHLKHLYDELGDNRVQRLCTNHASLSLQTADTWRDRAGVEHVSLHRLQQCFTPRMSSHHSGVTLVVHTNFACIYSQIHTQEITIVAPTLTARISASDALVT